MKKFLTFCCALLGFGAMAMADEVTFTYTNEGTNATITGVSNAGETLTIPGTVGETYTVVAIGARAFHSQTTITSVTIPSSVTSIGNDAFANCTSLQTVTFGEGDGGVGPETTSIRLKDTSDETSQLLTIGSSAFNGDIALKSITIPASVTTIASNAFAGCTSLASVTFEENSACTSIGASAFNGCSSLKSFAFPAGVTVVANDILAGCTSLASVTFSEATTEIGGSAFASCESLTEVTLPSTLTTIGYYCFGESGLTAITIPSSVTSIGDMAFAYLTFGENGVTNNSDVTLTSSMFYAGNMETVYMEWNEIATETIVNCEAPILIKWKELEDYRYIKFVITYDATALASAQSNNYNGWGAGKIYYGSGWNDVYEEWPSFANSIAETPDEVIYKVSTLKAAVEEAYASASTPDPTSIKPYADDEEAQGTVGFYVAAWSPATSVTLLAGPKIILPENKAYNFDDEVWKDWQAGADADGDNKYWPSAEYNTSYTVDGLQLNNLKNDKKITFQHNDNAPVMVGLDEDGVTPITYAPAYRVQLGGQGSTSNVNIGVPVERNCTLYVVAASSGDEERLLMVSDGASDINDSGFTVPSKSAQATSNCLFSVDYEGEATTLYIYGKAAANIFYIYVSYDGSTPTFPVAPEDTDTDDGGFTIGDSFISRFASQTSIWGIEGNDTGDVDTDGHVTWTIPAAASWAGIGAWFNEGVSDDVVGLRIKMIPGDAGAVKAYLQWYNGTENLADGSKTEATATTVDEEIELTILFDKDGDDNYDNADFRQVCVQFEYDADNGQTAVFTEAVLLTNGTSTAIAEVKSDVEAVEVARYNLMGQKISGAEKGINIIVYSDGSAKKVLVK